ncbi:hypothetical protein BFJ63_vAg5010 [Fusarium oxysporum f. sp. narcissi]|uniref:Post-SET domain-containing protein n=1 Tax=Fusarium oxysporum f. sp. narcissi TaxID=451672 RepID=A0A4Q2VZ65_FUSOX|nr:hypothetical protein BFJ63_vAg5010 [Fusarium oxysporum f. sp. narcissi]
MPNRGRRWAELTGQLSRWALLLLVDAIVAWVEGSVPYRYRTEPQTACACACGFPGCAAVVDSDSSSTRDPTGTGLTDQGQTQETSSCVCKETDNSPLKLLYLCGSWSSLALFSDDPNG